MSTSTAAGTLCIVGHSDPFVDPGRPSILVSPGLCPFPRRSTMQQSHLSGFTRRPASKCGQQDPEIVLQGAWVSHPLFRGQPSPVPDDPLTLGQGFHPETFTISARRDTTDCSGKAQRASPAWWSTLSPPSLTSRAGRQTGNRRRANDKTRAGLSQHQQG
jgi:hypothetical protein